MSTPRITAVARNLVAVTTLAASSGCSVVESPADADALTAPATGALAACVVAAPEGVVALRATSRGLVLATAAGDGATLRVQRTRGTACALEQVGAPIAAGVPGNADTLLDADDADNVYLFPAEAADEGVISTMLPDEYPGSMLARVDAEGRVEKLLAAGRGIWDFGVSPAGDAVWQSACGPSGLFTITEDGAIPSMTPPDTLWEQSSAVLTDAATFWSVGVRTCDPTEDLSLDCGFALVRATPGGSEEVGSTLADHGDGVERATLTRCGAGVCGVFARAVTIWDATGSVERTITLADAGALASERIAIASGNRSGVYLLLEGDAGTRVVFVPREVAIDHGR